MESFQNRNYFCQDKNLSSFSFLLPWLGPFQLSPNSIFALIILTLIDPLRPSSRGLYSHNVALISSIEFPNPTAHNIMTEVDTSSGELHNEEALMETFPSRRISTQAIDRLPKHGIFYPNSLLAELRRHALKRWTLLLGGIDIELLLKHATSISRTPLESQTFVKLLYRRLPVSHYTKSKAIDAKKCRRCGFEDETISHAIYECQQSALFWTQIHACLKQLLSQEIDEITLRDVVYFFPNLRKRLGRDQLHVLNVVHSVALFVLWSSRYIPQ